MGIGFDAGVQRPAREVYAHLVGVVLRLVAACCVMLRRVAACCGVLRRVAACCVALRILLAYLIPINNIC